MSNRVFKKVYGNDDLKVSPESEDEQPVAFTKSKKGSTQIRNPYELLNELSESEAKEDDEKDDVVQNSGDSSKIEDESSQAGTKKKKKRKNKNKKRAIAGAAPDKALDTELEDEEAIKERQQRQCARNNVKKDKPLASCSSVVNSKYLAAFDKMFKVDTRYLNSEFELKKIFGAKVIRYERSKQGQRRVYRQSKLVMPKEQWAPISGSGISMSYLCSKEGFLYFKFEHNSYYQEVQKSFMKAVDTLNPDNIVNILKQHPYHIDSHIQLSDMAKAAEDMQVAAEMIEEAVHCLENSFNAKFNLANPLCRLEYKYQENRPFFILLFKHLMFVGQRACHRTALELCKRLMCLDPGTDPLCVTIMIDFYALKAGEAEWLTELFKFWEKERNLDQLPNFSYSVALAYHLLASQAEGFKYEGTWKTEELSKKADWMIQYAIMMFPSILLPLMDKIGVQMDSRARNHSYFNAHAQASQSRSLKLLCELYVWRTWHVWKEPSVPAWLERNVNAVLDKVDKSDSIVADYEAKRKRRYLATTPRNILRHMLVLDNKDLAVNLPTELAKETILNYDPLPPPDAIDIYNNKILQSPASSSGHGHRRHGILQMLLSSLVQDLNAPNNDRNLQLQIDDAAAAVAGAGPPLAVGAGLQNSVTQLLDAMRDLLTNVNHNSPDGEAEAADAEQSGSDTDIEIH